MQVLLLVFGVMFLSTLVVVVIPWPLPVRAERLLVFLLSVGGSFLVRSTYPTKVLLAFGVPGVVAFLQSALFAITVFTDEKKQAVLRGSRISRRV